MEPVFEALGGYILSVSRGERNISSFKKYQCTESCAYNSMNILIYSKVYYMLYHWIIVADVFIQPVSNTWGGAHFI